MTRKLLVALVATFTLGLTGVAGAAPFPDRFELPIGFQPEGIASGKGQELFVGSIPTGDIYRIDARTGETERVVDAPAGSAAIGIEVVKDRLFVAGGPTGNGYVYDLRTGEREVLSFASGATFINDVTVTQDTAYFTDSRSAVLYAVDLRTLEVTPLPVDIELVGAFNLNGIEDAKGGKALLAVQSSTGTLFRIDPETGDAEAVDLGGYALTNGDGRLLVGNRLYVVQNRLNQIAVIKLSGDLESGRLEKTITSGAFDVPTTVARLGNRLYLPNARFGVAAPSTQDFAVTKVDR